MTQFKHNPIKDGGLRGMCALLCLKYV